MITRIFEFLYLNFLEKRYEKERQMSYNGDMEIFDTHTHLNSEEFDGRIPDELKKAEQLGVTRINNVGSNYKLNKKAVLLAEKFAACYATIGWHPDDAAEFDADAEQYLLEQLAKEKVIALGEIGLDYHWMVRPKEEQERVFRQQIQIAKCANVPFQVHTRDALDDTYAIIKDEGVGSSGAIMHSFSGTYEEAKRFVELGMMFSFSGVVTFKKAVAEQEAAQFLPLDKILVETDAPYLTPVPYRGRENTPGYTRYVIDKIAELRGISAEEVARITTQNALKIFKL